MTILEEFKANVKTFARELWRDFRRPHSCAFCGQLIDGAPHKFYGENYCTRECASKSWADRLPDRAREAGA